MKCADPILCYLDSKGNRRFRNFSFAIKQINHIPTSHIVFDCGKCLPCRKKRATELASRCVLHASLYTENCFITLTYDEKQKGYHNALNYTDIQKFKKRLRKSVKHKKIEIFNVHEYGKNGKKHWHLIIFNHDFEDKTIYTQKNNIRLYTSEILRKLWPYGYNTIGDVTTASAMYQAQYMEKDFKHHNTHNERKSKSTHSGIGRPYFQKNYKQILTLGYIPINGRKLPVPRYFQKLAHKHYCHFYDKNKFFKTASRKPQYNYSRTFEPNKEIADLYKLFSSQRTQHILDLKNSWDDIISQYLTTNASPDFIKSASNQLYDLQNKLREENF